MAMQADLRCSALAQQAATAFNEQLQMASDSADVADVIKPIQFASGSIVVVPDASVPCGQAAYLLEPYLERSGTWCKWVNNDGQGRVGRPIPDVIAAFCHFTLHHFSQSLIILDIQVCFKILSPCLTSLTCKLV